MSRVSKQNTDRRKDHDKLREDHGRNDSRGTAGGAGAMKNAEWIIKNGYKFSDLHCSYMQPGSICSFYLNDKIVGKVSGSSFFEAIKTWLDAEHIEPILDEAEKRYLAGVIRPFRDRVQYIAKAFAYDVCVYRINCYIFIHFNDGSHDMDFPVFHESKMYNGMKSDKAYTLEELGL